MTAPAPSKALSRRRILWLSVGLLGVLVVAALVWTGVRALLVSSELKAATTDAKQLQSQLSDADFVAAQKTADRLGDHARTAAQLSGDPIWRVVEYVPIVGANLTAVRVVSSQLDELSGGVIAPALDLASNLKSVWSKGGLDLTVLSHAADDLDGSLSDVKDARKQLAAVNSWALVGPVRDGVDQLDDFLAKAQPMVRDAGLTAHAIPAVLGQDGPQSILIMLQNGAELRTAGGLTGAFAEIHADHGKLEVVDQASSADFPELDAPIAALPASVTTLFDDSIGRFVQNISSPADFSVSSSLASDWWAMRSGHHPDTIVSLDMRVLAALLAVVGPVDVEGWGQLTSDNLIDRLLVQPYLTLDQQQQDALFERAVQTVFERVLSSDIDVAQLIHHLSGPIDEGRISISSAHPDVQSLVAGGPFAGSHARQVEAGDDAFAVYFNDVTGAKMDTFLKVGIDTQVRACRADGLRDVIVAVTLKNSAPADAGSAFAVSMTGGGHLGVPAGGIGTLVAVAAPPGTFVGGVRQDDALVRSISGDFDGYPVTQSRVQLSPGQSVTLDFQFTSAKPRDIDPHILTTPLINAPRITQSTGTCD